MKFTLFPSWPEESEQVWWEKAISHYGIVTTVRLVRTVTGYAP